MPEGNKIHDITGELSSNGMLVWSFAFLTGEDPFCSVAESPEFYSDTHKPSSPPPCFISFHLYLKPFLCLNPVLAATTLMQDLHQSMQILTLFWILQNWHPNKISRLPKSTATIRLGWGRESFLPSKNMLGLKRCQKHKPLHDGLNASGNLLQ